MKPFYTLCLLVLAAQPLLAQKDSALAELTKMRATLAQYESATPDNASVVLKKTTYDSLLALLNRQQQQLKQSEKEIELINKKLSGLNSGLPALNSGSLLVYFESGSKNLTKSFKTKIRELVSANGTQIKYTADGFADAEGPPELNIPLSKSRAQEVKKYMVETLKISPDRIITNGFGSEHRLCQSADDACNRQNRRVEIKVAR